MKRAYVPWVVVIAKRGHIAEEFTSCHEPPSTAGAMPADVELLLCGADGGRAAADVQAFRGGVAADLNTPESECESERG